MLLLVRVWTLFRIPELIAAWPTWAKISAHPQQNPVVAL